MIGDRWGVTPQEVDRRYPCDELVAEPGFAAWRGVTVRARAEHVWPWVAQLRLGPYSYDWIDNLGRRSPQRLHDLADPVVGEPFMTVLRGHAAGRILAVALGAELTGEIMGAIMSYVVVPQGDAARLLLKIVMRRRTPAAPLLALGDLIMARRQLLNLAALAERSATGR